MNSIFDCKLYDVSLSSLDERITVTDIRETLQVQSGRRESIGVEVRFCIHEEDPVRRREVMSRIITWGFDGGLLTVSGRPGQRLRVRCTGLPALSDHDWTEEMSLHFVSAHMPWWESSTPVMVSGNSILTLDVPGDAPLTAVEAILVNVGTDPVTQLTMRCHLSEITFRGINLNPGSIFNLSYNEGHLLAWVDGESVLHRRTVQSSDELLIPCGRASTVYATAEGEPLQATFTVRGRFA